MYLNMYVYCKIILCFNVTQHFKDVHVGEQKYTTSVRMVDDITGEY